MVTKNMIGRLETVKALLDGARSIVVLTGAGVSAESGVPTFRGNDGLWQQYRAESLACPEAFARDPELVWEFYNWRRALVAECEPNPAHNALALLEKYAPQTVTITQNVDGLHSLAGNQNVVELHGSLWRIQCTQCIYFEETRATLPRQPQCPRCGHLMRPGVVWFGEQLHRGVLSSALDSLGAADMVLMVGTSCLVQPAASFVHVAKRAGAVVVEINLEATPNTGFVDFALHGKAGEILPALVRN